MTSANTERNTVWYHNFATTITEQTLIRFWVGTTQRRLYCILSMYPFDKKEEYKSFFIDIADILREGNIKE